MKNILLFCCLLSINLTFAQSPSGGMYNDNSKIFIESGTHVVIAGGTNGDYYVDGASSGIELDGSLALHGDFINVSGVNAFTNIDDNGWVRFIGTTPSAIISGTNTFENFQLNRSTTSEVVLSTADLTINKQMSLDAGIVTTTASYEVDMLSSTASDLTTFSSTGFINGNLRRAVATNTSTYEFPVGAGTATTNYHRMSWVNNNLSADITNLTAKTEYEAKENNNTDETLGANTNAYEGYASGTTQMGSIVEKTAGNALQWDLTPDNYSYTSGTYGVNLYFNSFTPPNLSAANDGQFTVLKRPSNSTSYADWDAFASTTDFPADGEAERTFAGGVAKKTGFTTFSKFAIAKSANNNLPIELVRFDGECKDQSVSINWTTATETNNDYFTIEKSSDGEIFYELTTIKGEGNSNELKKYEYLHSIESDFAYYRLRQTDFDGKNTKSNIIYVEGCNASIQTTELEAYTSNNRDILVQIKTPVNKEYSYHVFDQSGRQVVETNKYAATAGNNVFKINTLKLASGIYILNIYNQTEQYSKKVFIK